MLYIPKIDDYLKILTDEEVKYFVAMYFSLNEEQNLRKVAKSLYTFLTTADEVEIYVEIMQWNSSNNCVRRYNIEILNGFDRELKLTNTKPMMNSKLKELLSEMNKFKVQAILVLDTRKEVTVKSSIRVLN